MTEHQLPAAPDPIRSFRSRMGGMVYGGDYNPEQWDRSVWREDVRLMQEAGVNLVSVGVFAWAALEPAEGMFDFEWLDEVLDLLHAGGISVNLATPTAAPPAWFAEAYPQSLPANEEGVVHGFGARAHYDPSSTDYRRCAARITTALAQRYGTHPAVAMWHIGNEYGPTACNPAAAARFRGWLRRRYGSLDALNEAWSTRFWGQTYTTWSQIDVPRPPSGWSNPTRRLDFKRFTSDMLLECYRAERDIVRRHSPGTPVATNFMRFYGNADYWAWAQEEDVVALDIYPNPEDPSAHIPAALNFDLMRSLRQGQPWMLMEQSTSAVSQWRRNLPKRHGRMRLGSYQAVAHGADAVMFFQWRASRGGAERFHSAMLPHSGTAARTWKDVVALGSELADLSGVVGAESTAAVALLFDWNNWWALGLGGLPSNDLSLPDITLRHYEPLWREHHAIDFIPAGADLSAYRLVVVPNAYLMDAAAAQALRSFVHGGGHLVVSCFSGVVDETNTVWPQGYPGAIRNLLGVHIHEYAPAAANEEVALRWPDGSVSAGSHWREELVLETAEALAWFDGGDLDGTPALTRNRVGDGTVTYLATRFSAADLRAVLARAAQAAGVEPEFTGVPEDVEVLRRSTPDGSYVFVLNHSDAPVQVPLKSAAGDVLGVDLLTGSPVQAAVALAPAGAAVVAQHAGSSGTNA